jgi:hypothetical protein
MVATRKALRQITELRNLGNIVSENETHSVTGGLYGWQSLGNLLVIDPA